MLAITGSTGLTGIHLVKQLKRLNIPFVEINRDVWDLTEWKSIEDFNIILKGVSCIFHMGAFVPMGASSIDSDFHLKNLFDANVSSCLAVASWATKKDIPIVFLSGSTVYKNPDSDNIHEDCEKVKCGLGGFYGYSKLLAENIFEHFRAKGLKVIILRASSIYGTSPSKNKLIDEFLRQLTESNTIRLDKPVDNSVNLIHAADVANAAINALKYKAWGTYNVAGARSYTMHEIAKVCIEVKGGGNISVVGDSTNLPFKRFNLNCTKAQREFNFCSTISLLDGIHAMSKSKILTT